MPPTNPYIVYGTITKNSNPQSNETVTIENLTSPRQASDTRLTDSDGHYIYDDLSQLLYGYQPSDQIKVSVLSGGISSTFSVASSPEEKLVDLNIIQSTQTKQFTSDITTVNRLTKQFTSDIITINRLTKQFISDIIIKKIETKQLTSDITTVNRLTKQFISDITTVNRLSKTFTVDTILLQYTSYGKPYIYWTEYACSNKFYLEVYMRATSGTIYARLIDNLDNIVIGSGLSTSSEVIKGLRSSVLTLVSGRMYRVQFAKNGTNGKIIGAKLLLIND